MGTAKPLDLDGMRRYWRSPTGMAQAPGGMVEYARYCVNALADEVERLREALRAVVQECEGRTFGTPGYDITLDHLHDVAKAALDA